MIPLGAGSLRSRPPQETLARATGLMPALGISRVSDITRMDRLGLPVFASVRPRGLALCVNAGKGLTSLDAHVGALMEAIEFAVAEPARSPGYCLPWRLADLETEWSGALRLAQLAPRVGPRPRPDTAVPAVLCEDIGGGRAIWLPAELIFMPFGDGASDLLCGWSSNGLASGNSIDEATLHALLEVLERDALAMNAVRDDSLWLPPSELPEVFRSLVAGWQRVGVEASVRLVASVLGLPCFRVMLHDGGEAAIGLAEGSGLHFDRDIALARAFCEAAQARLSHIHGGRDDVTHFFGARKGGREPDHETLAYREAFDTTRPVGWSDVPTMPCREFTLAGLLAQLIDCLCEQGFAQVLRHRFAIDLHGLHVVRIVVPGCEAIDRSLERMGPRLYRRFQVTRDG